MIDSTWQTLERTFCQFENDKLCIQLDDDYAFSYQTKLNAKDLFLSNIVFGKRCNEGGEKPKYRKTLDSLILSTDTTALKTWLKSPCIEKQLYALDGLYNLKDEGFEFNESINSTIELIEKKKGIVNTCSGCMYFSDSIGDVLERVKTRKFF
jgi:predicted metalloendopeptidase